LDLTDPFICRYRHWLARWVVCAHLIFCLFQTWLILVFPAFILHFVVSWNLVTKHKLFKLFVLSVFCYTIYQHCNLGRDMHSLSEKLYCLVLCAKWVWNYVIHTGRSLTLKSSYACALWSQVRSFVFFDICLIIYHVRF
jgi:hypothetical protein